MIAYPEALYLRCWRCRASESPLCVSPWTAVVVTC